MKENEVIGLLEELRKYAATGLHFSKDEYNSERYKAMGEKVEELYKALPGFATIMLDPMDAVGYVTPKVGVNAIIKNERGEYLLEKRMDDKCWGIVGGWAEVGLTAEENIIREIKEETGFDAKVNGILTVISRKPCERFIFTSYHILFSCEITGGTLKVSHESEAVAWKNIHEITDWHYDHKSWFEKINA
jgi:ADP-ribose pyrophosphatase YjhB (NUDIX family)